MMEAIRRIEQVKGNQVTLTLPDHFRDKRVEVIILPIDEMPAERTPRRRAAAELADTRILGDIVSPAVPADEWDALR